MTFETLVYRCAVASSVAHKTHSWSLLSQQSGWIRYEVSFSNHQLVAKGISVEEAYLLLDRLVVDIGSNVGITIIVTNIAFS